jgi:hypothetical protein
MQDEDYKKDMYLAFVNNALQQKANVSALHPFVSFLVGLAHRRAYRVSASLSTSLSNNLTSHEMPKIVDTRLRNYDYSFLLYHMSSRG